MPPARSLTVSDLAAMIDHTLLKAETSRPEIETLCAEAREWGFASVCVPPYRTALAAELLKSSNVKVGTVIGFPLGANRAEIKALEAVRAITDGATELDMVINVGAVRDDNWASVENEVSAVVKAAREHPVKLILETCLLSREDIVHACNVALIAGARFVKTSTGFAAAGAKVEDVRLMHETVGHQLGVKASGGIRDRETMLKMIEAGATRIGTSAGVAILRESRDAGAGAY
ncbi:MAG: deoxyribose-phosphate aldolase [Bdellovibrionales bacterium]